MWRKASAFQGLDVLSVLGSSGTRKPGNDFLLAGADGRFASIVPLATGSRGTGQGLGNSPRLDKPIAARIRAATKTDLARIDLPVCRTVVRCRQGGSGQVVGRSLRKNSISKRSPSSSFFSFSFDDTSAPFRVDLAPRRFPRPSRARRADGAPGSNACGPRFA